MDGILIWGKTADEHDIRLRKVMQIIKQNNLEVNKEKCQVKQGRVEFLGFALDEEGIKLSPKKVKAIKKFRRPATISELRSFVGLVTYVGSFCE